jgi:hypothetical protein
MWFNRIEIIVFYNRLFFLFKFNIILDDLILIDYLVWMIIVWMSLFNKSINFFRILMIMLIIIFC